MRLSGTAHALLRTLIAVAFTVMSVAPSPVAALARAEVPVSQVELVESAAAQAPHAAHSSAAHRHEQAAANGDALPPIAPVGVPCHALSCCTAAVPLALGVPALVAVPLAKLEAQPPVRLTPFASEPQDPPPRFLI